MAKVYEQLDEELTDWIGQQHLFFTATAPAGGGHVNCSPKGLNALRILDPLTVAYLDFTGSGVETIAHLRDNGRIVLMFCAFEGPPRILRLHGRGVVFQRRVPRFDELLPLFLPLEDAALASARSIVQVAVERIATSCGYGVPLMRYEGERTQLAAWAGNRLRRDGANALLAYQAEKNLQSIDGLPGLDPELPPLQSAG